MIIWERNNSELTVMVNDILVKVKNNIEENLKMFIRILMESNITIIMSEDVIQKTIVH